MNAAANLPRAARREDYEPLVKAMRPFIKDEEMTLRASLMLMRDRAMATKPRATEYAWRLLDVVERVASEHAMNWRVDVDSLREMRRILLNVVASASSIDMVFREAPTPDDKEAA